MSLRRTIGRVVAPPLIAGILAIHIDGCAGSVPEPRGIADPRGGEGVIIHPIGLGATIEITRRDGVVVRGRFRGTIGMSPAEYASHREETLRLLDADARGIPAPGDSIEIRPLQGASYTATFASFELGGVEVRRDSVWTTAPFGRIREVRAGRWSRNRSGLIEDAIAGRLPMSTFIRLGVGDREVRVPVDQVAQVAQLGAGHNGGHAAIGFLVGAGLVVLLVVLAVHDAEHQSCAGPELPPCYPFCMN